MRRTPLAFAAAARLDAPIRSVSTNSVDVPIEWTRKYTTSMSAVAAVSESGSPRSPRTISTCFAHGTSRSFSGDRTSTRTSYPAASRRGARRPPMYPVAPVTSTRGRCTVPR